MKKMRVFLISLLAAIVAGCASTSIPDPYATSGDSGMSGSIDDNTDVVSTDDGRTYSYEDGGIDGEAVPFEDEVEMTMIIYFDFDQFDLKPQYVDLLSRHANRLSNNLAMNIRLEGHADERGSREYNIGLGERRSQSVRRMLLIQGSTAGQISTVSFGEERPAAFGNDEESYTQNRRVEIKYLN